MSWASEQARAEAQRLSVSGDLTGAARVLAQAAAATPADAALANSAGNAALRAGDGPLAIAQFARAAALEPASAEYAINHAIALTRFQQPRAALAVLGQIEAAAQRDVRYCSVRAQAARDARDLAQAGAWYERAIALDPGHARALHGRARVAMERAEPDAVERYDTALASAPQDPELWLGKAQALDAAGRPDEAMALTRMIVEQAPQWLEAVRFLCQLNLAQGETDFTAPFAAAAARVPNDPNIPAAQCAVLAGLDRFTKAADVAAKAAQRFPAIEHFRMLEAVHAGEAGEDDHAETLWHSISLATPERALHEARHRLRRGDAQRAETLLEQVLQHDSANVTAWALRGIVWRLTGDPRSEWLHEQAGLVQVLQLPAEPAIMARIVAHLHALHDGSSLPLGQSLRGGTQTRGGLFVRHEPDFAHLRAAVLSALERYRDELPPLDPAHPLLRYRDSSWTLAGSWSVRLSGGGDRHASHIHPAGIVSSALYLELPDDIGSPQQRGWLELGRPPADLRLDLPPIRTIRPEAGHLALFPSTLYHGTTPFSGARRLTAAFDVNIDQDPPL